MNKHKGIVIDALFLCPFFRLFLPILLPFFMLKPIDLWLRKTPRRGYRKVRMAITSKGKGKSGGCRESSRSIWLSAMAASACSMPTTNLPTTTLTSP